MSPCSPLATMPAPRVLGTPSSSATVVGNSGAKEASLPYPARLPPATLAQVLLPSFPSPPTTCASVTFAAPHPRSTLRSHAHSGRAVLPLTLADLPASSHSASLLVAPRPLQCHSPLPCPCCQRRSPPHRCRLACVIMHCLTICCSTPPSIARSKYAPFISCRRPHCTSFALIIYFNILINNNCIY